MALAAFGLCAIAAACGADQLQAPRPAEAPQECRDFEQLVPRFYRAISTGQTEGLRKVVRDHLMVGDRPGDPPPVSGVLRAFFGTLNEFATERPERGAPADQTCAVLPPPLGEANPLCEARRAMDLMVHQGKGLEAFKLTDPLAAGALNYLVGRPPSSSTPHYEVAGVIAGMCRRSAVCEMTDGLDLVIGLTYYLESAEGKAAVERIDALVKNPELQPFLSGDGSTYGGENGIVALAKVIIQTTIGMQDPSELDQLPIDQLPPGLRAELRAILADVKSLLDPRRQPNVLRPLQSGLKCHRSQDAGLELVRMIYRLGLDAKLPEFGLTNLSRVARGLRETDQRGTILFLVRRIAMELRQDDQAVESLTKVCRTLFSTTVEPGQTRSNAELALPVLADLFGQGVAGELLCAADTLVFGCTGGYQPACIVR
ncbi:MAG: hypothetical protein HYZ28_22200 [Myxococcales bacterium]|nr:hypothetical protein [Myxococcales bacterium]